MALTDDLASLFHLDSTPLDSWGSNDLTRVGATYDTSVKKVGSASGYFDGVDDYFHKDTGVSGIGGTDQMTIALWIRRDELAASVKRIINVGNAGTFKFIAISFLPGHQIVSIFGNDADTANRRFDTTNSFTDQTAFHLLIITYNAGTIKVYYDNTDWAGTTTGTWTGDVVSPTTFLRLGVSHTGATDFKGWQDEVAIWNREITSAERALLQTGVEIGVSSKRKKQLMGLYNA